MPEETKTLIEKLHYIESNAVIYNIVYRFVGIGFMFFEGEFPKVLPADRVREKDLKLYDYHCTFEAAVDAEYDRLTQTGGDSK